MNLLARLLLEINVALFFFVLASEVSLRILLRHSGMLASMEGVVSGSINMGPVLSDDDRTSIILLSVMSFKSTYKDCIYCNTCIV